MSAAWSEVRGLVGERERRHVATLKHLFHGDQAGLNRAVAADHEAHGVGIGQGHRGVPGTGFADGAHWAEHPQRAENAGQVRHAL